MTQIMLKLRSKKLVQMNEVCVLLPESPPGKKPADFFDTKKKYPVLWLLHGASWDYSCFLYYDKVEAMLQGREVMVVMPSGLNTDFANHMEFANGYPMTDYFFDELMPYIYSMFPASAAKEDNYLAGYSMGGAAALMFGLLRPEKFAQVGVLGSSVRESAFLQPYLDWTGIQFRKAAEENPRRFPTEFGNPEWGITRKEINMIARYGTVRDYVNSMECTWERFTDAAKNGSVPNLLFCCGDRDGCYEKVKQFRTYAEGMGVNNIRYEFIPGYGHDRSDIPLKKAIERMGIGWNVVME